MGEGGHGETEDSALAADPQEKVEARRNQCNVERRHSGLANLSPDDFVRASTATVTAVESKTELPVLTWRKTFAQC